MGGCIVEGLDTSLALFDEITDDDIKKALNEIGKKAKKAMQGAAVVDTGDAKRSVKSRLNRTSFGYKLTTRFTEEYYAYQEFESKKAKPENIGRAYRAIKGIDEEAEEIFRKLPVKGSGL